LKKLGLSSSFSPSNRDIVSEKKTKAEKTPAKVGRPTDYCPEIVERFCHAVATNRKSIKSICKEDDSLPSHESIFTWLYKYPEFLDLYSHAKEAQQELVADEVLDIADDGTNDYVERIIKGRPVTVFDREHVQRSKLRVEARQWDLERLAAKKYGKKSEQTLRISPLESMSQEELLNKARELGLVVSSSEDGDDSN
jgi:hypothetical protein